MRTSRCSGQDGSISDNPGGEVSTFCYLWSGTRLVALLSMCLSLSPKRSNRLWGVQFGVNLCSYNRPCWCQGSIQIQQLCWGTDVNGWSDDSISLTQIPGVFQICRLMVQGTDESPGWGVVLTGVLFGCFFFRSLDLESHRLAISKLVPLLESDPRV